jgi:membrane protease YdiL (CAAX protease family)
MISKAEINEKPSIQLFLILALCFISVSIFSIIGVLVTALLYDFDLHSLSNYNNPTTIEGLKLFQLFSAVGLFIVPPIVYGIFTSKKVFKKLSLTCFSKPINYGLVILMMFISMPIMSWIVELNANMVLPDFLNEVEQWMRNSEADAMDLTKAFLSFDGFGSLIYVLIIVAVIPAIGEELLFRGVLQNIFIQWTKNPHWGIWITAFLFSALHMQFFGFFPRMLLGAVFGYLFLWSKSLWIPMLGHFINNGTVVVVSYLNPESINEMEHSLFADDTINMLFSIGSLGLVLGVLWLFRIVNALSNDSLLSDEGIEIQK